MPLRPRRQRDLIVALAGLLVLLTSAGVTARSTRPAPSPKTVSAARQLYSKARNLRDLRIPLRARVITRRINWAYDKLAGVGFKINRKVPIVLDTTQEFRLLRQTSAMLRGARKGSAAYDLRRKAVTRAFQLHRGLYKMPRNMRAYASAEGKQGKPELVLNLDNPFYNKADRLLPIVAHEQRHMRNIGRAHRLESILAQPALRDAAPGTKQHHRKRRLQAKVDALWSSPRAESRAFQTQAQALARVGWPLGNWWRSIQNAPIDAVYPPARLNRALVKGYLQGIARSIGTTMRDAPPKQRGLTRRYLAGYKSVLRSQATSFFAAARKDGQQNPALLEQYKVDRSRTLQRAEAAPQGQTLTPRSAFLAGQADAYRGIAALAPAQKILGVTP
jgi:hypothetical protein